MRTEATSDLLTFSTSVLKTRQNSFLGLGQGLRSLAVLLEDPGLIPSIHMIVHNYLKLQFQKVPCPLLTSKDIRHTCKLNVHIHKNIKKKRETFSSILLVLSISTCFCHTTELNQPNSDTGVLHRS